MSVIDRPLLNTDLDAVFDPRSVAIYGISERTSVRIAENMTKPGVPFYGINPTKTEACGVPCYPSMAECPAVPEMVVMGVGHGRIETAIEDVLSVEGVKAIITPGLGNEAGHDGPPISERISARVREAGIAMVGPNCMGIATPGSPSPWIGSLHPTFVPGPVATLAHSGSIGEILVSLGPRVGFRTMVSSGNETVVDAADFVAWFAQDPATRVIGLFLEAVRRPEAFEEALRRVSEAGKVAIVMKVGTSEMGAEAALAHTGALVGSDRSFSAMLRHYNAIRVDDFGDWIEHLEVFGREKPPRGRRIGVVTNSGGEGEYFADKAEQAGIPLSLFPEKLRAAISAEFPNFLHVGNPVDCWAIDDDRVVFPRVFQMLAESGEFDVLISAIDHSYWLRGHRAAPGEGDRRGPAERRGRHRHLPGGDRRDDRRPADRGSGVGARPRHPDAEGQPSGPARDRGPARPLAVHAAARARSRPTRRSTARERSRSSIPRRSWPSTASRTFVPSGARRPTMRPMPPSGSATRSCARSTTSPTRRGSAASRFTSPTPAPSGARPSGWAGAWSSPSRCPRASRC